MTEPDNAVYRALFEGDSEGLLVLEADTQTVVLANEALSEIVGCTRSEILSKPISEPPLGPFFSSPMVNGWDVRQGKHKDTTAILLEIRQTPFRVGDRKYKLIRVGKKKPPIEPHPLDSVAEMLGAIANEFDLLVQTVDSYVDLGLSSLEPENPLFEEMLQIHKASQKTQTLIDKLTAFGQMQQHTTQVVSLNTTLNSLLEKIQEVCGPRIQVDFELQDELWPIELDIGKLEQILIYTATNSTEAMPEGGHFWLKTHNVGDYPLPDQQGIAGDYVCLSIQDNGRGIDKQDQNRIFEPLFTTKAKITGSGLSLPAVYGMLKQHHGFYQVQSEPGVGTQLNFYFPRSYKRPETHQSKAALASGSEVVLLVDDDELIRGLIYQNLYQLGYQIFIADDGESAIKLCQEQDTVIDLLITDVSMPNMNGRQLADTLKNKYPNLRVLFMSGYPNEVIVNQGLLNSADPLIKKPFAAQDLVTKIRDLLDS